MTTDAEKRVFDPFDLPVFEEPQIEWWPSKMTWDDAMRAFDPQRKELTVSRSGENRLMANEITKRTKQNRLSARNSKPGPRVSQLETKTGSLPENDPLLNLGKFGFEESGGVLTNRDIDRIVYGA